MIGKDQRKSEAFYWSFLEFGADVLCQEAAWLVSCAARSMLVHSIPGAVSNTMRMLMHTFIRDGSDIRNGLLLPVGPERAPRLFFSLNRASLWVTKTV